MRRPFGAVLIALTVVAGLAPAASADTTRVDVVARGLDTPRGLTLGPGGLVLVTEAGRGGPGPCIPTPPGVVLCLGNTGAVTAIIDGRQRRVVTGLPSLGAPDLSEVLGPHDVALDRRGLLVAVGLGTNPAHRATLGPEGVRTGTILRFNRIFADLAAYEAANNPDGGQPGTMPDSNPYSILPLGDGRVVAVDAGGNDLLAIDGRGRISTLAVFQVRPVPGPGGGTINMHPVPTTVARGPDGALYVGQLTGFPFPPGGANIFRVVPGRPPVAVLSGFTNIIDIAFDRHGRLYVLEISKNGLLSGDRTGALFRVDRDGTRTEIAPGRLTHPTSVAVARDGALFVSNHGTEVGVGEVLRIRP